MTSPSRTKRRTTRPNTRSRGSEALTAALAVWLLASAAPARDWRSLVAGPAALQDVGSTSAAVPARPVGLAALAEPETTGGASADKAGAVAEAGSPVEPPCAAESEDCREALSRLRHDPISGIDLDIRVGGRPGNDYPCECRLEGETFQPRRFAATNFTWKAAGYCHKPLYFEDWRLERYGHSHGFVADSFTSAAHFFVTLPVLPYKMGVELPWECVYPLGYYRPGSCAPWTVPAVPISVRGFAVEAATITGLVFLLP